MSGLKDILSGEGQGGLPEDKLIAYLEGKLSPEEQHEVERFLSEENMESDAVEGLKYLDPQDAKEVVGHINHALRKKILAHAPRHRKAIKDNPWTLLAIVLTLLFAILAYFVIRLVIK